MNNKPLRWGLISTARINRKLIPALRASKRSQLAAVASRTQTAADAYARQWNIPRAFGSYEDLLADPEIDVVYNPLPNHLHIEWSIKAMQAGKHVLCEKPLALTLEAVDELAAAAREYGRVVAEAFMYRHHPQTLKVKEIVDSGKLGEIQLIKGAFTFMLSNENDIRLNPQMGGGSIWDVGCYPISYIRTMLGQEPQEVFGQQVLGPGGVDVSFIGQMRFPGEVYAQFDSGFRTPFRTYIEITGRQGCLHVPVPFSPQMDTRIELVTGERTRSIRIRGQKELYQGEVEDLADAVLLGKAPRISLQDSRANIAAIRALLVSAETQKPVLLK
ncbi:MAG: Gfo/Idh/MocA family oxidoreductase [Anaerolineales bacterium]|nr:Gfo/Idh/MocA family oxidoreductase [Anaerolineales bacterium]